MDSLLQSDIFFFVTTIAVAVATILLIVCFVYIIRVLRDVRSITSRVKKETDNLSNDVADVRRTLRQEGAKLTDLFHALSAFIRPKKTVSKKKSKLEEK